MITRRATRKDANQKAIVKSLRGIPGVTVTDTSGLGDGFADIVVGYKKVNYLFEIKDGNKTASRRKLTPDEIAFHNTWKGQIAVVKSFDEAFKIIMNKP